MQGNQQKIADDSIARKIREQYTTTVYNRNRWQLQVKISLKLRRIPKIIA
jgi:hypothetical protein